MILRGLIQPLETDRCGSKEIRITWLTDRALSALSPSYMTRVNCHFASRFTVVSVLVCCDSSPGTARCRGSIVRWDASMIVVRLVAEL